MYHAFNAMNFAREVHKNQIRKYTGEPYSSHLSEVVGIVATTIKSDKDFDLIISVAWLHDCVEDQGVTEKELAFRFGEVIASGVMFLSDLEQGNRAARKEASRVRLSSAPDWVQTIKVADIISNTQSIVKHDLKFAIVYLEEKRILLDVLTKADKRLVKIAIDLLTKL